jgi:hypothetical protein
MNRGEARPFERGKEEKARALSVSPSTIAESILNGGGIDRT